MSDVSKRLADAFRAVARQLASLSDEELAELIEGTATVRIETKASRDRAAAEGGRATRARGAAPKTDLGTIAQALSNAESRDEGERLLKGAKLTAPQLKELARMLDVTVQSKDTKDKLQIKVIEGTIGFRLRSRAIRGY